MKYYFFKTVLENANSKSARLRLRPLPGQTMEDGTPINEKLNVQSPDAPGENPGGNRSEYPEGTTFCSNHLELNNSKGKPFYSVYSAGGKASLEFHPVSDDPDFKYAYPAHKSEIMNAALMVYNLTGTNDSYDDEEDRQTGEQPKKKAAKKVKTYRTPKDEQGNARPANPDWQERYPGQIQTELQVFVDWIKNTIFSKFNQETVTRINARNIENEFTKLYSCGETIDTIASTKRFENWLKSEDKDYIDIVLSGVAPGKQYLDYLIKEHEDGAQCTAEDRDYNNDMEAAEAADILVGTFSGITGVDASDDAWKTVTKENAIRKAIKAGWTLDAMINPEKLKVANDAAQYLEMIADGSIQRDEDEDDRPFIEQMLDKYKKPSNSEGFHVEDITWKALIENVKRKKNTLLTGPSGSGKTEIIKLLCKRLGLPCTLIQMGSITDPTEQLVGKIDLALDENNNQITVFDYAPFALAIQKPGVIIFDEINRIPKNGENMILSCLDDNRELSAAGAKAADKRTIKVHPDCCFFATANIGAQYTATKEIDEALATRFMKIEVDYMGMKDESKILCNRTGIDEESAMNIAFVARRIREMSKESGDMPPISTRETLRCAEYVVDGFTVLEAMELNFLPLFDKGYGNDDPASERASVRQVISQRFMNNR